MLQEFTLQPEEVRRLQLDGKWLIVTQATGPLELIIGGTTPVLVDEKDRIHLRDLSPNDKAIRVRNVSGAVNNVELHTSDLLIDKRTATDLKNAIEIAPDQLIGIDANRNIVRSVIQNPIRIDSSQNTVQAEVLNAVRIDGRKNTVKAEVQNPISINPDHNTVRIEPVNTITTYHALPAITFGEVQP